MFIGDDGDNETLAAGLSRWRQQGKEATMSAALRDVPSAEVEAFDRNRLGKKEKPAVADTVLSERTRITLGVGALVAVLAAFGAACVAYGRWDVERQAIHADIVNLQTDMASMKQQAITVNSSLAEIRYSQQTEAENMKRLLRVSDAMLYAAGGKNKASSVAADN